MRRYILLYAGSLLFLMVSCKSSEDPAVSNKSDNVIAVFADQTVTLDELKSNFYRNRTPEQANLTDLREFYPSYINYRLKLYEGLQQGFQKDSSILAEYNQYASEIAYRYWIENKIKKERINEFKKRFEKELKAFHILKELPSDALPPDTAAVYNTLLAVRDSLLNGASPEEMNERHSSRRNGKPVGGNLAWITAGSTIQPFEEALYNLKPGEISMPVRSQFGYHLILLQDIRPRTPQRLVRHIFVQKTDDNSDEEKIERAFMALQNDTSWSVAVKQYTDDPSTKNRDGLLGWIGYGTRFPQELIETAMNTPADSAYSRPVEVSYGYHIMRIDSIRTFLDEEQKEEFVVNKLQQLERLEPDRDDVYHKIAEQSDIVVRRSNFDGLPDESDFSELETDSTVHSELIYFNGKSYSNNHFQDWLKRDSALDDAMESGDLITSYRNHVIEENLVEYTRKRFPEFARQTIRFMDDLIVFKVNEEFIWNPEAVNQEKLKEFYKSNIHDYKKEKTFVYTEISTSSDSLLTEIYKQLKTGVNPDTILQDFENVQVYKDSTSYSEDPVYATLSTLSPGEFSEPITVDEKDFIYILHNIRNERFLSFDEAYNMVFSDYQPIHEKNFISWLKEKYQLELFPENLK